MPRIQPVDRKHLDNETLSLLRSISGGDEPRWNVFAGITNHPATLGALDGLTKGFVGCGYCLPAHL